MPRILIVVPAILATLLMATSHGRALDLGLTPSQVYDLWANINAGIVISARLVPDRDSKRPGLDAMSTRPFENKAPADVLAKVIVFRDKFNRLRRQFGLGAIDSIEGVGRAVTPSIVFLNSGRTLDGLAEWLIRRAGPKLLISPIYTRREVIGKTASDVLGLADLANRRLDVILARSGLSQG